LELWSLFPAWNKLQMMDDLARIVAEAPGEDYLLPPWQELEPV
jgi:hypothetical protein